MADQPPVPEQGMALAIALLKAQIARDDAVIAELRAIVASLRDIAAYSRANQRRQ